MSTLFPNLRRRVANLVDHQIYADKHALDNLSNELLQHRTPLWRPLEGLSRDATSLKVTNLQRVIESIDGIIISPGEAFSFWRIVGKPSLKSGFRKALGGIDGSLVMHMGGGIPQATNLIFWMAAQGPFEVLERWRHTYDLFPDVARTLPFGSGATVLAEHRDLRLKNSSVHKVQIRLWLTPTHLHGALYSDAFIPLFDVAESDHRIVDQGNGKFTRHNKIWRIMDGKKKLLVENNALLSYVPTDSTVIERRPISE